MQVMFEGRRDKRDFQSKLVVSDKIVFSLFEIMGLFDLNSIVYRLYLLENVFNLMIEYGVYVIMLFF